MRAAEPSTKGFNAMGRQGSWFRSSGFAAIIVRVELRGDAYPREMAVDSVLARLRSIPDYVRIIQQGVPS